MFTLEILEPSVEIIMSELDWCYNNIKLEHKDTHAVINIGNGLRKFDTSERHEIWKVIARRYLLSDEPLVVYRNQNIDTVQMITNDITVDLCTIRQTEIPHFNWIEQVQRYAAYQLLQITG